MSLPRRPAMSMSPPSHRVLVCALLAGVLAAGCAPSARVLRTEIQRDGVGQYLPDVPFVRQRRNWCGPAALASVAQHYGLDLSQKQIAREIYLPSIRGTLTIDLQRCARDHGLWAHAGRASVGDIRRWLDRGVPVIALLRHGWLRGRAYHYVVITGYHSRRGYVIAHLGHVASRPLSFGTLARRGEAAGRWILAACPPERVAWPLTPEGHNDLGLALERQGKLPRARAEYEKAIAAEPGRPIFHFNRANVLARLGDRPGAERAYREAIRLKPRFAEAHNNLANILLRQGRHGEARREAARAIEIGGARLGQYHDTLGHVLLALERRPEAVRAFRDALDAAGSDAKAATEARLGLIEALVRAGRRAQATAERDRLLANTSDPAVRRRADDLLK